jgi:hypothetical protein
LLKKLTVIFGQERSTYSGTNRRVYGERATVGKEGKNILEIFLLGSKNLIGAFGRKRAHFEVALILEQIIGPTETRGERGKEKMG